MPKPEKLQAVAQMKELFQSSGSLFVTDYQGLNVAEMTGLRKNLRESGVKYLIAKNTLMRIAAKEAGVEGLDEFLIGPTAVAFSTEDPAVAAKVLNDSFKKRELPRMKVFVVDKKMFEGKDIGRLAELPSREILLSQVVASVEAPFTSLIGSIEGFFRELIYTIDALAKEKG